MRKIATAILLHSEPPRQTFIAIATFKITPGAAGE